MTVYIVGEPLDVYANRDVALEMLAKCLQDELQYVRESHNRWAIKTALDQGETEMALRLWQQCKGQERPRLRFEEHEVRE